MRRQAELLRLRLQILPERLLPVLRQALPELLVGRVALWPSAIASKDREAAEQGAPGWWLRLLGVWGGVSVLLSSQMTEMKGLN